jgi:hypothetical protein
MAEEVKDDDPLFKKLRQNLPDPVPDDVIRQQVVKLHDQLIYTVESLENFTWNQLAPTISVGALNALGVPQSGNCLFTCNN